MLASKMIFVSSSTVSANIQLRLSTLSILFQATLPDAVKSCNKLNMSLLAADLVINLQPMMSLITSKK